MGASVVLAAQINQKQQEESNWNKVAEAGDT